jgi:hypothetical protein
VSVKSFAGAARPAASFEAVLSSLRQERPEERTPFRPWSAAAFHIEGESTRAFPAAAQQAFEEFAPAPPPLPSADEGAIAAELSLSQVRDASGLHALRRRFMWENHPDRRPDLPRDLANRRVAIANMLIDRALRHHTSR